MHKWIKMYTIISDCVEKRQNLVNHWVTVVLKKCAKNNWYECEGCGEFVCFLIFFGHNPKNIRTFAISFAGLLGVI